MHENEALCGNGLTAFFKTRLIKFVSQQSTHDRSDIYQPIFSSTPCTLLVVQSGGRELGNLFTAVANHVAPRLVHGCGESCRPEPRLGAT